jgi:hypothetical protein
MHFDGPHPQGNARQGGATLGIGVEVGFEYRQHVGREAYPGFIGPGPHQLVQVFGHQKVNLLAR